jgi:hypothetical protein
MTSYFSGFVDFVGTHPHYALTAVFLLALSEAIPVIGTVVPGSTLIVGISALAAGANVNPWLLLIAATVPPDIGPLPEPQEPPIWNVLQSPWLMIQASPDTKRVFDIRVTYMRRARIDFI